MSDNPIRLRTLQNALDGMTPGRYTVEPSPRLQGAVSVEIGGDSYQVASMCGDAPARIGSDVAAGLARNALGFAVLHNHAALLLEIADAALVARTPITDEESARAAYHAEKRLDRALAKVRR